MPSVLAKFACGIVQILHIMSSATTLTVIRLRHFLPNLCSYRVRVLKLDDLIRACRHIVLLHNNRVFRLLIGFNSIFRILCGRSNLLVVIEIISRQKLKCLLLMMMMVANHCSIGVFLPPDPLS